jgi:hypothetical protein
VAASIALNHFVAMTRSQKSSQRESSPSFEATIIHQKKKKKKSTLSYIQNKFVLSNDIEANLFAAAGRELLGKNASDGAKQQ